MSPHYKKTSLIFGAILLIVSCFLFAFLYKKTYKNNAIANQIQLEWQTEANQRQQINSLDSSLKSIENEKIELESHFAQSSDIVPFLDTIEKLGAQAGTHAEVSSVDIPKDNSGLLVGMKASGSFEAVYKFLLLLENSPYEFEFVSMSIQRDAGSSDEGAPPAGWSGTFRAKLLSFIP